MPVMNKERRRRIIKMKKRENEGCLSGRKRIANEGRGTDVQIMWKI
jgi:hypothetical protein